MTKSIKIIPSRLQELYETRKLSSPKIAEIYKCDPKSIRELLRKYKIKIRTKSEARKNFFNINIPRKELKKFYLKERLSSPKIAKKYNCSAGFIRNKLREYKIPIRSIQEALPLSNKPIYPRYNFNGNLEEKAYLIGLRKGDLHVRSINKANSTIAVNTNSSKSEMIDLLSKTFTPYGYAWTGKPDKNNVIGFRCHLDKTFLFLLNKEDKIDSWILKNKKYFAAFLAGYTDSEGTFCLCSNNAVFSIRSQDKNILHQIRNNLVKLGIFLRPSQISRGKGTKDKQGTISNEDIWGLWIHRKDALLKLFDLLNPYLRHKDKQNRVKILKENISQRNKKHNNQQDTKWHKEYLKEGICI
ncbi:LAGLIDADG family homing endonuclease [Patescibacteria group bacterium]|nr:LAGLIDADG family homing endonuclease [Patescibacteria group bacterium]MBU1563533.1 LAGLIDADG family homing endonuclease [Patescibacteria group bacterium]MBU2068321.1 LAGLIDADG family homing endonuclease [Patescibacteria group bacterium]